VFLFPITAFCWFLIISALLGLLAEVLVIENVFLISMATLATIRITAYYNERLSREIAKTIPLALLGVYLLNLSNVSALVPVSVWMQTLSNLDILFFYFIFIVVLELVLKEIERKRTPKIHYPKKKFRVTMTTPGQI